MLVEEAISIFTYLQLDLSRATTGGFEARHHHARTFPRSPPLSSSPPVVSLHYKPTKLMAASLHLAIRPNALPKP